MDLSQLNQIIDLSTSQSRERYTISDDIQIIKYKKEKLSNKDIGEYLNRPILSIQYRWQKIERLLAKKKSIKEVCLTLHSVEKWNIYVSLQSKTEQ